MSDIDETHDPRRKSWVASALDHPEFPIQNLPLGVFSRLGTKARPCMAIGDLLVDLPGIGHLLGDDVAQMLSGTDLNHLLGAAPVLRRELRHCVSELLSNEQHIPEVQPHLIAISDCRLHCPGSIGNYTDFYTGIHHAVNAGKVFRPDASLNPNYKWIPIAYHGRASSVRPSGIPVMRPNGQRLEGDAPSFGATQALDYELEMGVWIGRGNTLGDLIGVDHAEEHAVGLCLLNDWSARDVQGWEMQPLGPFLSKSFHTSISPWIVTLEALAPFRVAQPARPCGDPPPLPHLRHSDDTSAAFRIDLEVYLSSRLMREQGMAPFRLSRGRMETMYWTMAQMIAHHTSNGCNLETGDLLGTGTLSEPTRDGFGSLLEISRAGQEPVSLPSGETRSFVVDGDEISFSGRASATGFVPIGFGECRAEVVGLTPDQQAEAERRS
jgi:fumarylacetoacetase